MTDSVYEIEFGGQPDQVPLGPEQRKALRAQLRQAGKSGASAVVITVTDDAWDYDARREPPVVSAADVRDGFHALVTELFSLTVPVVAYLDGRVTALGLSLALACDLRFATSETTFGVGDPQTPDALVSGTSWLLAKRAGSALAADLSWTGRRMTADEALRLALLTGVTPDEREAREHAVRLAAAPRPATSALKRSLNGPALESLRAQLDYDSWLAVVSARA